MPDLDRARAYPYHIPRSSYLLSADGHRHLAEGEPAPDLNGRHAVIASGSNQSPHQLARKYDATYFRTVDPSPIPVLRTRIENFDSVYSPHFSSYGSIAATLHFSPGVSADLFITWLSDAQLHRMHETEAVGLNYEFARLDGVEIDVAAARPCTDVFAYIGRRGSLSLDGQPISLSAIPARGRHGPAMTQDQVQTLARDRVSPGLDLDRFIGENIESETIRHERTRLLATDAVPFSYDGYQRLETRNPHP